MEFAYPLVKGGIAIHTKSKEERDNLYEELKGESFRGGKVGKLSEEKPKLVFLKNVDTKVNINEIVEKLKQKDINIIECKRILNTSTQRPTKTIKVTVATKDLERVLQVEIRIGEDKCRVERQTVYPVIRCYECQQFGHIGKNCTAEKRCVICAGDHSSNFGCKQPVKCRNCEGEHPASDSSCVSYRKQYENIAKQYSKYKHI